MLRQLMGSATRDLFKNIFAFSLFELQQFESLGDEAVKGAIYSAGLGTGKLSMPDIDRNMEKEMEEIFKPGGTKPAVNLALGRLREIKKILQESSRDIAEFDDLNRLLNAVQERITDLQAGREAATRRQNRAKQLLDAWEDWILLSSSEKDLAELPEMGLFPDDGLSRLERMEEKLAGLSDQILELDCEYRRRKKERDEIDVDERVLEESSKIAQLQRRREHYESALHDIPVRAQELADAEKRVSEGLQFLGPTWDVERLMAFDTSVAERDMIRGYQKDIQDADYALREARTRLKFAEKAQLEAVRKQKKASEALQTTPQPVQRDLQSIVDHRRTLMKLAVLVSSRSRFNLQKEHTEERIADLEVEKQRLQRQVQEVGLRLPIWPIWAAAVIGLILGGVVFALGNPRTGLVLGVLLAMGGTCGYLLFKHKLSQRADKQGQQFESDVKTAEERLLELTGRKNHELESSSKTEAEIEKLCSKLELDVSLDEVAANVLIEETEAELEKHRRWSRAREEYEQISEELESAEQAQEDAKQQTQMSETSLSEEKRKWANWLVSAGLPQDVSPDGALEIIGKVQECRERQRNVESLKERLALMQETVDEFQAAARQIAQLCGYQEQQGQDAGEVADRLGQRLQVAQEDRSKRENLDQRLRELHEKTENLKARRGETDRQKAELLEAAGTADSEQFRARARIWEQRQALERDIKQRNMSLKRIVGQEKYIEGLRKELKETTRNDQETLKRAAEEELSQLGGEFEQAADERGKLREQLARLESEERRGELRLQEEILLSNLNELVLPHNCS